jgi:hypothetical protein
MVAVAEAAAAFGTIVRVGWQAHRRRRYVVYSTHLLCADMSLPCCTDASSPSPRPAITRSPAASPRTRPSSYASGSISASCIQPFNIRQSVVDRIFVCDVRISILRHEAGARLHVGRPRQHHPYHNKHVRRTRRRRRSGPLVPIALCVAPLACGLYTCLACSHSRLIC